MFPNKPRFSDSRSPSRLRPRVGWRLLTAGLLALIAALGSTPGLLAQSGSIHPLAIEIDKIANLYPGDPAADLLNPGATADWIKDSLANTDVDNDPTDPIAVGIVPGVTGAAGGRGHWNGVRIVDGIANADQDIFLTGGKENDTSTWNVGPGSVGSSKYDITQAYIANNQSFIYFGMERRGNNGSTAFDFEFNQAGAAGGYIPVRTVGDVLLTFEMQGSGKSGSAIPHVFRWDGTAYVEISLSTLPPGLVTSINSKDIQPAPWGYVDSQGNWVLTPNIPRFEFAEAAVPLSVLPNVNACGGFAFVQVRTRSSSTATSDLKDTTKIFRYVFGGPSAVARLTPSCTLDFDYSAAGSADSGGNTTNPNLTYSWQFQRNSAADGSGAWTTVGTRADSFGTFTAPSAGRYRALLTVTETAGCSDPTTSNEIDVSPLSATASKTQANASALSVTLTGAAPSATGLQWQRLNGASWVDISGANSASFTYSAFETDTAAIVPFAFSIGSDSYAGKLWEVQLRLRATRNTGGLICVADSPPVTVKKVTGVDP